MSKEAKQYVFDNLLTDDHKADLSVDRDIMISVNHKIHSMAYHLEAYHQERMKQLGQSFDDAIDSIPDDDVTTPQPKESGTGAFNHEAWHESIKVDYLRSEMQRIVEDINNITDAKTVANAALKLSAL